MVGFEGCDWIERVCIGDGSMKSVELVADVEEGFDATNVVVRRWLHVLSPGEFVLQRIGPPSRADIRHLQEKVETDGERYLSVLRVS